MNTLNPLKAGGSPLLPLLPRLPVYNTEFVGAALTKHFGSTEFLCPHLK